jgi:3-oxoacyl-[acyl-carrier protein] reductase
MPFLQQSPQASERVALITGGVGGIGLPIAIRLASFGTRVVIADVDATAAEQIAREHSGADRQIEALGVDVADEGSVIAMYEQFDQRCTRLDMLVNCAGISPRVNGRRPLAEETPLETWQRTLSVNLTGTFLMCRGAVPRMRKHQWGRIVNLASIAGRTVSEVASCYYAASKSGVLGLSRVLADELGPHGITVNCVSPSRVSTEMTRNQRDAAAIDQQYISKTPVGRMGTPADVAAAVLYLLSEEASFVNGAILDVTGGYFMP